MADQQLNALCLDLGTVTGWAVCYDKVLTSGTMSFKNNRFEGGGMRYLRFIRWLEDVRASNPPVCVFFEEIRRPRCIVLWWLYGFPNSLV